MLYMRCVGISTLFVEYSSLYQSQNPTDIPIQHNDYPIVTGTVIYHLILADISSALYLVPDMPFAPGDKLEVEIPAAYIMSSFT